MASPSQNGNYVIVDDVHIWWQAKQSNEIHVTLNDTDFWSESTDPGMRVVFSCNPKSANYHPANYNRCARVLRQHGKPAPAEDVPEGPRRLDKR